MVTVQFNLLGGGKPHSTLERTFKNFTEAFQALARLSEESDAATGTADEGELILIQNVTRVEGHDSIGGHIARVDMEAREVAEAGQPA